MINENNYKKEMNALKKVKAPKDFLEQVHLRLGKSKKAFFPMPLRLASVAATLVLMVVVYNAMKPDERVSYKVPGVKIGKETRPKSLDRARDKAIGQRPKAKVEIMAEESLDDLAGAGVSGGIGVASKMAAAPKRTRKDLFSEIDHGVATIDRNLADYKKEEKSVMESTEGGSIEYYRKNGQIKKIVESHYGEVGKSITKYYFLDNDLAYVLAQTCDYNTHFLDEAFDEKKTTIRENKYYFDKNKLIKWLDANNQKVSPEDKAFQQKQAELFRKTTKLLP